MCLGTGVSGELDLQVPGSGHPVDSEAVWGQEEQPLSKALTASWLSTMISMAWLATLSRMETRPGRESSLAKNLSDLLPTPDVGRHGGLGGCGKTGGNLLNLCQSVSQSTRVR